MSSLSILADGYCGIFQCNIAAKASRNTGSYPTKVVYKKQDFATAVDAL
jgi:hypothetical protein